MKNAWKLRNVNKKKIHESFLSREVSQSGLCFIEVYIVPNCSNTLISSHPIFYFLPNCIGNGGSIMEVLHTCLIIRKSQCHSIYLSILK